MSEVTGNAMTKGARLRQRADAPGVLMREEIASGLRPRLSAGTLERIAEAEFAARTHGGWTTPDCPACGLRVSANGTCDGRECDSGPRDLASLPTTAERHLRGLLGLA